MMQLAIFMLAVIGFTLIIVESKIFERPKKMIARVKFLKLFSYQLNCYQCTGFWGGMLMCWLINPLTGLTIPNFVVCGCIGSFVSMIGAGLLNMIDR
jgi:hypothetical protein